MIRRPLPRWKRGVQDRIYEHVYSSPGGEVGGVLVGDIPASGPVRITAAIPALRAEGERASVTFTHDAWSDVHAIMERKHKGKRIVGWYHSHPGFGIFLSDHDLFIQRNFFSDPAQVAYVVDPHASTEGLFGWVDGDIEQVMSAKTPRKPVTTARGVGGSDQGSAGASARATAIWAGVLAAVVAGAATWFIGFNGPEPQPTVHTVTRTVQSTVPAPEVSPSTATPIPPSQAGAPSSPGPENYHYGPKPRANTPPAGSAGPVNPTPVAPSGNASPQPPAPNTRQP